MLMWLYSLASSWVSRLSDLGRVPLAQSMYVRLKVGVLLFPKLGAEGAIQWCPDLRVG